MAQFGDAFGSPPLTSVLSLLTDENPERQGRDEADDDKKQPDRLEPVDGLRNWFRSRLNDRLTWSGTCCVAINVIPCSVVDTWS